jgi:hypothetical protein
LRKRVRGIRVLSTLTARCIPRLLGIAPSPRTGEEVDRLMVSKSLPSDKMPSGRFALSGEGRVRIPFLGIEFPFGKKDIGRKRLCYPCDGRCGGKTPSCNRGRSRTSLLPWLCPSAGLRKDLFGKIILELEPRCSPRGASGSFLPGGKNPSMTTRRPPEPRNPHRAFRTALREAARRECLPRIHNGFPESPAFASAPRYAAG